MPMTRLAVLVCVAMASATSAAAEPISLDLPVRCELGRDCFVQNYVDHDPTRQARDYQCGTRTYDGRRSPQWLDLGGHCDVALGATGGYFESESVTAAIASSVPPSGCSARAVVVELLEPVLRGAAGSCTRRS